MASLSLSDRPIARDQGISLCELPTATDRCQSPKDRDCSSLLDRISERVRAGVAKMCRPTNVCAPRRANQGQPQAGECHKQDWFHAAIQPRVEQAFVGSSEHHFDFIHDIRFKVGHQKVQSSSRALFDFSINDLHLSKTEKRRILANTILKPLFVATSVTQRDSS